MKITENDKPPQGSAILNGWDGDVHYADSFKAEILNPENLSVDDLSAMIFADQMPEWVKVLMLLRDFFVSFLGLKTGKDMESKPGKRLSLKYMPGESVGFFPVIARQDFEIVMGLDDRHLYFRVSVLLWEKSRSEFDSLFITTVVQFHNIWGRIYFFAVKPFHRVIVKNSIKRFLKKHKEFLSKGD